MAGRPAIWAEISPVLYPVVGWTRDGARVGGRRYPLGLHGFASGEDFAVETAGGAFARLTLRDNVKTRALYPFAFEFAVEYRLAGPALEITLEAANPGDAAAPYACGLHPGLRAVRRSGTGWRAHPANCQRKTHWKALDPKCGQQRRAPSHGCGSNKSSAK